MSADLTTDPTTEPDAELDTKPDTEPDTEPAVVRDGSFLTLHYRLSGADGVDLVNTFGDHAATLTLGTGELAAAVEERLIGLAEGTQAVFDLPAGAAFGERNPALLQRIKRRLLDEIGEPGEAYAPGDVVRFPGPEGAGGYAGVVQDSGDDWVLFDFNHPLAGQAVRFDVHVLGVL